MTTHRACGTLVWLMAQLGMAPGYGTPGMWHTGMAQLGMAHWVWHTRHGHINCPLPLWCHILLPTQYIYCPIIGTMFNSPQGPSLNAYCLFNSHTCLA